MSLPKEPSKRTFQKNLPKEPSKIHFVQNQNVDEYTACKIKMLRNTLRAKSKC
jgi:hypothetical protein